MRFPQNFRAWQSGSLLYWIQPWRQPSNCESKFECRRNRSNKLGQYSISPEVEDETGEDEQVALWIPQCPVPERLWEVYRGRGADTMVSSAFKAAQDDLAALSPPKGLTEELFTAYVAGILRQMPLLIEIDKLASTGLTDTKAHDFLSDQLRCQTGGTKEYGRIWRIVKLWLIRFFPESYRLETDQEVLVKGREIPRR